ncbi:MAG TPA: DUF559 domain-containing protein [Micromonosporaceae bacterium]|nr:DUF559 domain-containing protein [Micromonosporaceae bacterium]
MPPQPHRPRALTWQVFRGSDVVSRGLLTRHQLRSSAWVRLRHDVYADARLEYDHGLSCRAAALRLPSSAVLAGPSAAYLLGVEHAAKFADDVHVIVPTKARIGAQQRLRVHSTELDPFDITASSELARTSAERTAWDVANWCDTPTAVAVIDTLLGQSLVTPQALRSVLDRYTDRPGNRRAQATFRLADGRAQSPPESVLRVRLVLDGLPPPVPQYPIRVGLGLVLHPDLAWPEFKVAVEYDGHWHGDPDQLHRDRRRLNQLVSGGWLVLHVTSQRLHRDFPAVLREVRAALVSRGWHP